MSIRMIMTDRCDWCGYWMVDHGWSTIRQIQTDCTIAGAQRSWEELVRFTTMWTRWWYVVVQFQNVSDIQQFQKNHNQNAHFDSMLRGWGWDMIAQGQWAVERDWADSSTGKRVLWVCIRSCRGEEIETFPTLPAPQSKFRLCILYEQWWNCKM